SSPAIDIFHSFPTRRSSDLGLLIVPVDPMRKTIFQHIQRPRCLHGRVHSLIVARTEFKNALAPPVPAVTPAAVRVLIVEDALYRSEEHTSELQSRENLVCRL